MVMGTALPDLSNLDADALRQLLITQHHEFHEKLLFRDHEIEHTDLAQICSNHLNRCLPY